MAGLILAGCVGAGSLAAVPPAVAGAEATPAASAASAAGTPFTIKDTAYPVPAGAIQVAITGSDTKGNGSRRKPFRTFAKAVATAPAGGTIVLRSGEYREAVGTITKRLIVQPYPNEKVWFKGSVEVGDWTPDSGVWRMTSPYWSSLVPTGGCPVRAIDTNPLACTMDMVFVDGAPLTQVATLAGVAAGTFYVDRPNNRLYLGSAPAGRRVEVSKAQEAFELGPGTAGSVIRGLGFSQYAPVYWRPQVRIVDNDTTFENNTVVHSAMFGLSIVGHRAVVRGNNISFNGMSGINGYLLEDLLVEGNAFNGNNAEHFAVDWEASGVKLTKAKRMTFRDNVFDGNWSKAYWCDSACVDLTFVRNYVANNIGHGFKYEISHKATVASNVFANSSTANGLSLSGSSDLRVWNNTFSRNQSSVVITQEVARPNPPKAEDVAQGIDRCTRGIELKNNIISNGANLTGYQLISGNDQTRQRNGIDLIAEMDFNAWYRTSASKPTSLARFSDLGGTMRTYPRLDDVKALPVGPAYICPSGVVSRSSPGREANSLAIDGVAANPFFRNEAGGDYRLTDSSVARGAGTPLPADIAAAVGVPVGPIDLGALRWPGGPP